MESAGGFDHNANTIRVLTLLEMPYPDCTGLNLSWETLEGLATHNGPVTAPSWALAEYDALHPLDPHTWPSLEAQVAALPDETAYATPDIAHVPRCGHLSLSDPFTVRCLFSRGSECWRPLPT